MANETWGGARAGSGRKNDGKERRAISWKISEDEKVYLRRCLDGYRIKEQNKPEDVENSAKIAFLAIKDGAIDEVVFAPDKANLVNKIAQWDEKLSFYISERIKFDEETSKRMKVIFPNSKERDAHDKINSAFNAVIDYYQRERYCTVWTYKGESTVISNITHGDTILTAAGRFMHIISVEQFGEKLIVHGTDKIGVMAEIMAANTVCFKIEGHIV